MIDLIVRLFIKNYKDIDDSNVRNAYGKLSGIIGITTNFILFIIKIIGGLISNSISIITDAINNLSDMGSSLLTLVGFKLSGKPADEKHPFGHERMEYITGLIISFVILFIGGQFFVTSINKIINPEIVTYSILTISLLIISILIKIFQGIFYKKCGKKINSLALIASSSDSFFDCLSTLVILIGAIISIVFNINIDGYMGIIVASFILFNGLKLVKDTIDPLLGTTLDLKTLNLVLNDISKYEGVLGYHDIVCHMYGPKKCFMSLHIEMSALTDPLISHELIDKIETDIKNKYNIELVVHYDPITNDETTIVLKERIKEIIKNLDETLEFHDFRVVKGINRTNLVFDVVIPFNYKMKNEDILKYLEEKINTNSEMKYVLVIKFDNKLY